MTFTLNSLTGPFQMSRGGSDARHTRLRTVKTDSFLSRYVIQEFRRETDY